MTKEKKKKVLIADDSQMNCEMLSDILGDEYEYIFAKDGNETLMILSEGTRIDILLLDMNMPNLGGMDVLKVMREREWNEEIPVVIISAEDDMGFIQNAYQLGAVDYIVRPFNSFLVCQRVKNTIELYQQRKKLVRMVEEQVIRREKNNDMLLSIFSHIVERANHESGSHSLNVQIITQTILKKLVKTSDKYKLSEEDIAMISSVSALHDIGKLTIPEDILNKPGKLTPEEWEIMKAHTVNGDEFLSEIEIDHDEKLMITAHEICRHHHERYDGKGYPDGLAGDDIPLSAQVVSVADVYDALTNDRCYKKAFSHETAVSMILGGECGAFNPEVLKCFEEISDELYGRLAVGGYDVVGDTSDLTREVFEDNDLAVDERSFYFARYEREKKEFFAELLRGIQFEYDAVRRAVNYIYYYDDDGNKINLTESETRLLSPEDWDVLIHKTASATPENPDIEMKVVLSVNGDLRWYKLNVKTIWLEGKDRYVEIVGQFTEIHNELIAGAKKLSVDGKPLKGETIIAMRDMFDIVRVVNPKDCSVVQISSDGGLMNTGQKCYKTWGRRNPCKNCTSDKALDKQRWISKLELKDGIIYSVLSGRVRYGDEDYVLEIAFCSDEEFDKSKNKIGFLPDSSLVQNFYKDTLTKTYSRAYLDNFAESLERAKGIAIADVDKFKQINDTFGHVAGDAALKHISKMIKSCMDENDAIIRYGGDEFLLLFNDISEGDFFEALKKIKQTVAQSEIEGYPEINPKISIGGAYGAYPIKKAIDIADKAMYKDKFDITE